MESKLRIIENGLNAHHSVVEEIKKTMDQIAEKSQEVQAPLKKLNRKPVIKNKPREFKVVGDEPPRMHKKINMSYCPTLQTSKADVQVNVSQIFY